jgi:CDP-paratose synthetase
MKTVLVTGATGFLGSSLVKKFCQSHKVVILKRTTSSLQKIVDVLHQLQIYDIDAIPLEEVFKRESIDVVIHTATCYGRGEESLLTMLEANLFFPLRLLESSIKNKVGTFINTDTALDQGLNEYALTKAQFLEWLKRRQSSINVVNLRLEHFYGPDGDETKFITRIIRQLILGQEINLTLGEQKRDFFYIDDLVEAYLMLIDHLSARGCSFVQYELGSGTVISIKELLLRLKELVGSSSILNFGAISYRAREVMLSQADLTAISELGWRPRVALNEGLKKVIDYERAFLCHGPKK